MKAYAELTEIGRARRLRPLVAAALRHFDIEPIRVRLLTNSFNGIFRVDTRGGERFVLRVVLPSGGHEPFQVEAEAVFVRAVAQHTNLSVPVPVPSLIGDLVVRASAEGVPEARMCVLWTWVPGGDLAGRMTAGNWQRLGALMAGLHEFASAWTPPEHFQTISYDRTIHFGEPMVLFDSVADRFLTVEQRRVLERGIAEIDGRIAALDGRPIVIHGDLHQWNVKVDRNVLHPLDFEDLQWAHPIQDVATTFYYLHGRKDRLELIEAFRRGYTRFRPWVEEEEGELDWHVVARGIDLVNFVIWSPEEDATAYQPMIDRVTAAVAELT